MKRIILVIIMLSLIIISFQKPKKYIAGKKTAILPTGEYNTYPGCKFATNADPIDVFSSYPSSPSSSWVSTDYDGDGTWEKYGFGDTVLATVQISQCGSSLEHCDGLYITAQLFIEDFTLQGDDVYTVYDPCRPYTYQIAICRNDGKNAQVYYRDYGAASNAIIPPCGGGCTPESNSAFCSRLGKTCGDVTANDNCGTSRTVNCGTCSTGYTCSNGVCTSCTPNWQCTSWSTCPSSCTQTRTCTDSNSCGTTSGKPAESQSCTGGSCPTTCPANICDDNLITYNELISGLNKWIGG